MRIEPEFASMVTAPAQQDLSKFKFYESEQKAKYRYDKEVARIAKPTMTGEASNKSKFIEGGLAALSGHVNSQDFNPRAYALKFTG